MHMADALLAPGVAGIMYACSTAAAGHSIQKLDKDKEDQLVPVMGVMGAFVFAAQMINFTIPGTGSSGHLCGGMLLTAVVGPYAAFLTMIGVLLIQCLLFADGGLMALGAKPGPGLRGQLEALLEAVITGQLPNERKALLAAVKIELDP